MTQAECLKILESNNPFASSSVSDPKDHPFPDVPSINKKVYDSLIRLLRHKLLHPSMGLAALVLGEAGDGKSHLIHRLLKNRNSYDDLHYMLAYIHPIEDPGQTFSYLLREMVTNLFYPIAANSPFSIMDELMANLYKHTIQNAGLKINAETRKKINAIFKTEPVRLFTDIKLSSNSWKTIQKTVISIHKEKCTTEFFHAIFELRHFEKRHSIMEWLKCNTIDSEEARQINVNSKSYLNISAKEQAARDMIKNISAFISLCQTPFLVCFDRLENLDHIEKVKSFGRMIEFLVDDARSMMPIAFCRGDLWDNQLKRQFNVHVTERLTSNTFVLEGCTTEKALELINSRLTWAYNDAHHDYCPFTKDELEQRFESKMINTRIILQKTNQLLMSMVNPPIVLPIPEQLMIIFRSQYQKVLNDFDRYSPERLRIKRALSKYFEVKNIPTRDESEPYIDFSFTTHQPSTQKGIVIIDMNNHHRAVGAALKRGIEFLKKNHNAYAFYIRDERCLFPKPPKWKVTNELLDQFTTIGGHAIMMNRNEAAQCYAITLMIYAIKEGDISIETPSFQNEKVTIKNFVQFLKAYVDHEPLSLLKQFTRILKLKKEKKPKTLIPDEPDKPDIKYGKKEIMKTIIEYLRPIPMMLARINEVRQYLIDSGIQTEKKELTDVIKRFNDRFAIYPSKTDTIVMIRKEWINAQP